MATPAQIANDMAAHATYWSKRDKRIERACRKAASQIRDELSGKAVDGRSYYALHRMLLDLERDEGARGYQGYPKFSRARLCLEQLRRGVVR